MTPVVTKRDCVGCRDNFYNGNNPYGVEECWLLAKARMVTRYRLSIDTPMNQRRGYQERTTPHCFHEKGYVYVKQIPEYAS